MIFLVVAVPQMIIVVAALTFGMSFVRVGPLTGQQQYGENFANSPDSREGCYDDAIATKTAVALLVAVVVLAMKIVKLDGTHH